MSRLLSLAFLSMAFVCGLSIVFAPRAALADKCDNAAVSACRSECMKNNSGMGTAMCTTQCQQTMEDRRKKGQCK